MKERNVRVEINEEVIIETMSRDRQTDGCIRERE